MPPQCAGSLEKLGVPRAQIGIEIGGHLKNPFSLFAKIF